MSYTEAEIQTFHTIEQMIQAEFASLDASQKQALAGLLSQPIQPIPQTVETPKCYETLKQLLEHPPTENLKKLTQLAIALALEEQPQLAGRLRNLVITSDYTFSFRLRDYSLNNLNFTGVQALAYAMKAAPQLAALDLSDNYLSSWKLEEVQALADAIKAAPRLASLDLSCNRLDRWDLEQFQAFVDAIKNASQLASLDLRDNGLGNWDLTQVQAFADAVKTAPQLASINLSYNSLDQWDLAQVQAFVDAVKNAPRLSSIDLKHSSLWEWDLEQVQAFADAIKNAPQLSVLDLSGNDLGRWDLEQVQTLADAIKAAPQLAALDLSGNRLDGWRLPQVQAFADAIKNAPQLAAINLKFNNLDAWSHEQRQIFTDAIRDNFLICEMAIFEGFLEIQPLLDRNKNIRINMQQWETFFHTPITESSSQQVSDIHEKLVALEEILATANTPSAKHYLARLPAIRFDAFYHSLTHGQSFLDCCGWLLNSVHQWIALDEHYQRIVDGALLKAAGSDLPADHKMLAPEDRLTFLKHLLLQLQQADVPTSSCYSPTFHSPASIQHVPDGKLTGTPMDSILEKSDAINQQFAALPKEYKNPVLQQLYEVIIANKSAVQAQGQNNQHISFTK